MTKPYRPDWTQVYRGIAHTWDRDDQLLLVTRETIRLSKSAIRTQQQDEAYHNFGAAEYELKTILESNSETKSSELPKFEIGDSVVLISGGPTMVVSELCSPQQTLMGGIFEEVECIWFDHNSHLQREIFNTKLLDPS